MEKVKTKTAQQIIDESNIDGDKNMKMFYPTLFKLNQADSNITKCLRKFK